MDEIINDLMCIFHELEDGRHDVRAGPLIKDSVYSQMIARVMKTFSPDDQENAQELFRFFERNPEAKVWVCQKIYSPQGRRDFRALLRIELM